MSDLERFASIGGGRAVYDAHHRCLSIWLVDDPKQPGWTDVQNGLLLDYDADGRLVGVEALLMEPLNYDPPGAATRTGNWPCMPVIEVTVGPQAQ